MPGTHSLAPRRLDQLTQPFRPVGPASLPRRSCKIALAIGAGPDATPEFENLLRRRLRVASLILAIAFTLFFARNLLDPDTSYLTTRTGLALSASVNLVAAGLSALLWSRRHLCLFTLRMVEILLFASPVLFFAWSQFCWFHCTRMTSLLGPLQGLDLDLAIRQATGAMAGRWFAIIVIYGVFIPNTWQRCLAVVSTFAGTHLLLNVAVGVFDPIARGHFDDLLLDPALIMGIAVSIAVFGSYKLSSLRQEAAEARKLGQYRLKERLGAGGMGEVYLAEHVLLRRPCAVKLIRPDQAGDPATLQRFEREVQAMATLTHWNTVEIFDYGHADDGTFYYVMEYLPGLSLQELVERSGPVPPARAIHLLRQVCRALREAHGIGLIHRDIKPSNILVCERGGTPDVAKLLDFGLVQQTSLDDQAEKLTVVGTIVGSPPFMAPEQAMGTGKLDARGDIYSVGGVAYFLLTGQAPFVRDTALQMLMAHAYEPVIPPGRLRGDLPEDLQAVILRCLEKDPEKRFPDAESLEKALAGCADADGWTEEAARQWWQDASKQERAERTTEARTLVLEAVAG